MEGGGLNWFGFGIVEWGGLGKDGCVVFWGDFCFGFGWNIYMFIKEFNWMVLNLFLKELWIIKLMVCMIYCMMLLFIFVYWKY